MVSSKYNYKNSTNIIICYDYAKFVDIIIKKKKIYSLKNTSLNLIVDDHVFIVSKRKNEIYI